jgi:putative membrane protein
MYLDFLLAALHFSTLFLIAGFSCSRFYLARLPAEHFSWAVFLRADRLLRYALLGTALSGFARMYWGIKGMSFFLHQEAFLIKFVLFLVYCLVVLLARRVAAPLESAPSGPVQARLRKLLLLELHIFAILPFLASWMARGL